MTLPSNRYGCWGTGPLQVPWPDSRPDCGYPPGEMVGDERCRGCYEHPDRKQMEARAAESQAIEAKINILQDLWWARWKDGRVWSSKAQRILDEQMSNNRTEVDIRVTIPDQDNKISLLWRFLTLMRPFFEWLVFRGAGLGTVGRFEGRDGEIITWAVTRQSGETDERQAGETDERQAD